MSGISHGKDTAKRYHKPFTKVSKGVFTISHLNRMPHFIQSSPVFWSHQGLQKICLPKFYNITH